MGLNELIGRMIHELHPFESFGSSLIFIGVILCTFVQISPIKINPWDVLLGWIGERFNSGINKKINIIDKKVDKMERRLDEHIEDKGKEKLKNTRRYIISFVNNGINGKRHTKESFDDVIKACDEYEQYVKDNDIKNGVIDSSIAAIRLKYQEHLVNADFAPEEYYIAKDKKED